MKKIILSRGLEIGLGLAIGLAAISLHAHEGHDHDAPINLQAKKGGQIKSLENVNIEVLAKGKDLKVYVFNKEMRPEKLEGFEIKAFAELPRSKDKPKALVLTPVEDHLAASFDAKSAHRYTLTIEVKDPTEDHADSLKFTIEPKR